MRAYTVKYRLWGDPIEQDFRMISFLASTKLDAFQKAEYEILPKMHEGRVVQCLKVYSVTYQNGKHHFFK